jgi:hypothetical protein
MYLVLNDTDGAGDGRCYNLLTQAQGLGLKGGGARKKLGGLNCGHCVGDYLVSDSYFSILLPAWWLKKVFFGFYCFV